MLKIALVAFLILVSILQAPVYAGNEFELTIQVFYEQGSDRNIFYSPPNNIIKTGNNVGGRPFKVVLRNITSSTQSLRIDEASKGLGLITFEITDEKGNNNVVTKKVDVSKVRSQGYNNIGPGKTKEFEILLTEQEWENAYKLVKQGATKVRARASYSNGSTVIYSDYYTIIRG